MTATALLIDIAATMAGTTGVAGIHKHQQYPCPPGFVDEERAQLSETPIVLLAALPLANRDPVADVRQLFKHKRGLRVFGIRYQRLRDGMVHRTLKAGLLTRQLLQASFGTFRGFLLTFRDR